MVLSSQKSQYSVIGCPPRSEFCEGIQSKRQIDRQGDRPTTMTRYLPFHRYKKHLGLDVNIKNACVKARAEVRRHNAIPVFCGDENCNCSYPRGLLIGGTNEDPRLDPGDIGCY